MGLIIKTGPSARGLIVGSEAYMQHRAAVAFYQLICALLLWLGMTSGRADLYPVIAYPVVAGFFISAAASYSHKRYMRTRSPIAVAHGEGYADFSQQGDRANLAVSMRFVDHLGAPTEAYPFNPNGSPDGIASATTPDGRFTVLMPHPERVFRTVQMSWYPTNWGEESPWMRMFRNARVALG